VAGVLSGRGISPGLLRAASGESLHHLQRQAESGEPEKGTAGILQESLMAGGKLTGVRMFDSDMNLKSESFFVRRRAFLVGLASTLGGLFVWSWRRQPVVAASAQGGPAQEVTVVQFSDEGQRLKKVRVPKVVKSEEEWRKQLSSNAFDITRHADTEMAFSGQYWNLHDKGMYRCICCDNPLFSS